MIKLKIKILFIVLLFCSIISAQNTLDSLKNVVNDLTVSANKLPVKVSWDWMPIDSALSYDIYYCSADDTTLMPVKDGATIMDIWDWKTGNTIYNYCWVKRPLMKYLRIGIVGANKDGKATAMKCKTYANF